MVLRVFTHSSKKSFGLGDTYISLYPRFYLMVSNLIVF